MKVERIEVRPHLRNPVGSFAVIKLRGINRLQGPATFRLEPTSSNSADERMDDWPAGERKPLGIRAGANSVELLIGPEIVKSRALADEARVRFVMPHCGVDATIAWPNMADADAEKTASATAPDRRPEPSSRPSENGLSRLQVKTQPGEIAGSARARSAGGSPPKPATVSGTRNTPKSISAYAGYRERVTAAKAAEVQASSSQRFPLAPGLLGLLAVATMFVVFASTTKVDSSRITLFSALSAPVAPGRGTDSTRKPSAVLAEILEVGSTSPNGIDATGVSHHEALQRANALLASAGNPNDRAEAAFWLRKALSRSLSKPRLVWAITQLGTAYASSDKDNKPNYEAARLLWSWAADAGDAHAACFLGRLFERGLGGEPNPKLARENYERARRLGGCPGLEQAMLRVKSWLQVKN